MSGMAKNKLLTYKSALKYTAKRDALLQHSFSNHNAFRLIYSSEPGLFQQICINADTKIELAQQLTACFSSGTAQRLAGEDRDRAGAACVTPPCTASPASRLTPAGSDVRAAAHSHCHTAQTWHGSIQGHHPAGKQGRKPSLTPSLTEGMPSTKPASQPGGLYLQVSGSANRTAAHKKLLLEKPGVQLRNTKPIKLNKCLV